MPVFKLNKPVVTREPQVLVENKLKPGKYTFRLVVTIDGVSGKPLERTITVAERMVPLSRPGERTDKPKKTRKPRTPRTPRKRNQID